MKYYLVKITTKHEGYDSVLYAGKGSHFDQTIPDEYDFEYYGWQNISSAKRFIEKEKNNPFITIRCIYQIVYKEVK